MSGGRDAGESSPSAAASASPGSAGVCAETMTAAGARVCWAKCAASVTESVANGSASAWGPGAGLPGLATLEGVAALAVEGDVRDVLGFGSVGPAARSPAGVVCAPASKSTQSERDGVRLLVGAAWSTGGALPSAAAANGSAAANVSSDAPEPGEPRDEAAAAAAVGGICGEEVPAVSVGDSDRRAVAAAIAAVREPEGGCPRGIPVPESNPEAEPDGETAAGETLEVGDADAFVGDVVAEWYARACASTDRSSGDVAALCRF